VEFSAASGMRLQIAQHCGTLGHSLRNEWFFFAIHEEKSSCLVLGIKLVCYAVAAQRNFAGERQKEGL
jgi:hypothetical protein